MWMPIKPGGLGHFAASEPCNGKNILHLEISNKASGQSNFQPTWIWEGLLSNQYIPIIDMEM